MDYLSRLLIKMDVLKAGLKASQRNLMNVTDLLETLYYVARNIVAGKNYFRNDVIIENCPQRIERAKNRIALYLLALVSMVFIDEANWGQIQAWIIDKFIKRLNAALVDSKDQNLFSMMII